MCISHGRNIVRAVIYWVMMTEHLAGILRQAPRLFIPTFLRPGFSYTKSELRSDVLAGLTVTVILVPQAMALALIAGLPAIYGLYASLPGFIASLFGSSRQLSTGPVAIVSFLTLTSLLPFAEPGSPEFIAAAAVLALLVGMLQLLMGTLRLGFIMDLIPHSAIAGFSSAAAAIIVLTQIPTLLGYSITQHEFVFQNILEVALKIGSAVPIAALVGMVTIIFLYFSKRLPRTFPATLIALFAGVGAAYLLGLEARGVPVVGAIPSALPSFTYPLIDTQAFFSLLPKAAIVAFVGFVEAYSIAKSVAAKSGQTLDTNQELVGQGLANLVAGMFRGYPVSGSFLRTAVNTDSGAKTGFAAVVTAIATVMVLLFFTPVLSYLPRAVLAAIVIMSALSLIDIRKMREMRAIFKTDGTVAFVTFAMAFILKPDDAIFIGVVLALFLFIRQTMWGVQVAQMGIDQKWHVLRSIENTDTVDTLPGCLILRPGMSFYYANTARIVEQLRFFVDAHRAANNGLRTLVIDYSGVNSIDITGAEVLGEFITEMRKEGIAVNGIYLRRSVRRALESMPHFPETTIYHNIAELRQWCGGRSNRLFIAKSRPDVIGRRIEKAGAQEPTSLRQ